MQVPDQQFDRLQYVQYAQFWTFPLTVAIIRRTGLPSGSNNGECSTIWSVR